MEPGLITASASLDPKERLKEEKDGIVLSPQRRSFGTGCHVTHQPLLQRALSNTVDYKESERWVVTLNKRHNWAVTRDFQQCGILRSVDSDEHVQPPFNRDLTRILKTRVPEHSLPKSGCPTIQKNIASFKK